MKKRSIYLLCAVVIFVLAILACNAPTTDTTTLPAVETQVDEDIQPTEDATENDAEEPVQEEEPASEEQATATPSPTQTPAPTEESTSGGCPDLAFIRDVTIPDGTRFAPGEEFEKTWLFENDGTCTLENAIFAADAIDEIYSPGIVFVPDGIQPGEQFEITVRMIAPIEAGTYRQTWHFADCLMCSDATEFGPKPYVQIEVDPALADSTKGRLMGGIRYPSEGHPAMAIYAQNVDTGEWFGVELPAELGGGFTIEVPPGTYVIYVWVRFDDDNTDLIGGYVSSEACEDYCLAEVEVAAGEFVTDLDLEFLLVDLSPEDYPDHLR